MKPSDVIGWLKKVAVSSQASQKLSLADILIPSAEKKHLEVGKTKKY